MIPRAYHLQVQLDQEGAAVREIDVGPLRAAETADGIPGPQAAGSGR